MKFDDLVRAASMMGTLATEETERNEQVNIRGFVGIQDMEGIGLEHVKLLSNLSGISKYVRQSKLFPLSPKGAHLLNMPSIIRYLFNFVTALQDEKMRGRNVVHKPGDLTKLHEAVGREILPIEYGGTNGTLVGVTAYWKNEVEQHRDWLLQWNKYFYIT